ncbi:RNA-binding S4 domain-containing protein [Sphingomonas sp. DT-204]|uniref:RNA-binding S4 domain-containing protein n=1 Tax=Sphingomonas sp. DT-204 TaxID=3396166 RepID=UPI003F1DFB97
MVEPEPTMRLDKYLWFTRLARTRSFAQEVAEARHLRIDGRVVEKAAAQVRVGNVLTFPLHGRVRVIRIEALPARRGPASEAQGCYTDLELR